jgi:hypothetical protein
MDHSDQMHEMRLLERELFQQSQSCLTITLEGDQLYFNYLEEYRVLQFSDSIMLIENQGEYPGDYASDYAVDYAGEYYGESLREIPIEGWSVDYLNDKSDHIKSFQIRYKVDLQIYTLTFKKSYPRLFLYSMQEL